MDESATKFIPGLRLSRKFYERAVCPIINTKFPKLKYSAALFGWGSEVLGYDTGLSRDHHWGPRVFIFLSESGFSKLKPRIHQVLADGLPYEFMGYSTNFSKLEANGVRHPVQIKEGPVNHLVDIYTLKEFFAMRLRFNPYKKVAPLDWLMFPQQRLLEMVSGEVYHDGLNQLEKIRAYFTYFPTDIWLYLLSVQWTKISQEEAFVGRTGDVGDELGSQVVASRIVRELMRLCFLMEKQYYPYSKWFGTAFCRLKIARPLSPIFRKVLLSSSWKERERWLVRAYQIVATKHNALRITKPLPVEATNYYGRPYLVIHADRFASAIRAKISDKTIRSLPNIGSVDQFTDSTDISENLDICKHLNVVYEGPGLTMSALGSPAHRCPKT